MINFIKLKIILLKESKLKTLNNKDRNLNYKAKSQANKFQNNLVIMIIINNWQVTQI